MLRKIYHSSPLLAVTGWMHIALLVALLAAAPFDHRLIMGINPWIKPMKFAISIAIYVWTVAWMLEFLPRPQRSIEWGVAVSMIVEMVLIALQAARGTTSHFNQSTPFNQGVFIIMGLGIVVNLAVDIRLLLLFLRPVPMPVAMLWGLRLGLILLLAGSADGFVMIAHRAHTIGFPDGGPGLPLVNWSTRGGDLRVAHFLGIHALQILPFAGWIFQRIWPSRAVIAVFATFSLLLAVLALTLAQAAAGRPLIAYLHRAETSHAQNSSL